MTQPQPAKPPAGAGGLTRRFAYLLGAFWVGEALQALFNIVLARWDPVLFGQLFLGLSLGQMVLFVSEFGLNQHLTILLAQGQRPAGDLLRQANGIKAGLLLLAWLGLAGFVFWQGYSSELRALVLVLAAGLGMQALASTFYVWLQVQGRQGAEAGVRVGASLLSYLQAFAALWMGAAAWLLAAYRLLESLAALLALRRLAAPLMATRATWPGWRELWREWGGGLVFTAMAASSILYNRINVVFLHGQAGDQVVAQYGAAWQVAEDLTNLLVTLLLQRVLLPKFLGLWRKDRAACLTLARGAAQGLLLVSLALAFLLYAASPDLVELLYGSAYGPAAQGLRWLSCTLVLGVMHNLAANLMITMGRQRLLLGFFLITLAVNLVACWLLIAPYHLAGAVAALVLSKVLLAGLSLGFCQLRLGLLAGTRLLWLALALAAGLAIFLVAGRWCPPLPAALAGLLPLAALAWRQRGLWATSSAGEAS